MNPIKWLLWKTCDKLWDYAWESELKHNTLLYYSCLGIIKFSPGFNEKAVEG